MDQDTVPVSVSVPNDGRGSREDGFEASKPTSSRSKRTISDDGSMNGTGLLSEAQKTLDFSTLSEMERLHLTMKMEMRCPSCGLKHPNPRLINSYRYCYRCNMVLAEPHEIIEDRVPRSAAPLRILASAYGHPTNAALAIDTTQKVLRRVEGRGARDRLVIRRAEDLRAWLGDPCPGQLKVLRVRYAIRGVRGELWLREAPGEEGHAPRDLDLRVPKRNPVVRLEAAYYGHPRALERGGGRWCFDVREFLQARLHESGGYNIRIGHDESLHDIFGDPSEGREKDFIMQYEIMGTAGKVHCQVIDGRIRSNVFIRSTPVLMPLVLIQKATYGMSEDDVEERMRKIYNKLMACLENERRKKRGLRLTYEQEASLKLIPELKEKLIAVSEAPVSFEDVRAQLQRCVEAERGVRLLLRRDSTDLNALLGRNPCPGLPKNLRVEYTIAGHDSEKLTSSEVVTGSGYQRNFITSKKAVVFVEVEDDEYGRGILAEDVKIEAHTVLPVIEINAATFGHPTNVGKCFDVGAQIRGLVEEQGGTTLEIPEGTDLVALWRDPCRGVRKRLTIAYVARGLNGTVRVPDLGGYLASDVFVGHPIPEEELEEDARSAWTSAGTRHSALPRSLDPMSIEIKRRTSKTSKHFKGMLRRESSGPIDFYGTSIRGSFKALKIEDALESRPKSQGGGSTPSSRPGTSSKGMRQKSPKSSNQEAGGGGGGGDPAPGGLAVGDGRAGGFLSPVRGGGGGGGGARRDSLSTLTDAFGPGGRGWAAGGGGGGGGCGGGGGGGDDLTVATAGTGKKSVAFSDRPPSVHGGGSGGGDNGHDDGAARYRPPPPAEDERLGETEEEMLARMTKRERRAYKRSKGRVVHREIREEGYDMLVVGRPAEPPPPGPTAAAAAGPPPPSSSSPPPGGRPKTSRGGRQPAGTDTTTPKMEGVKEEEPSQSKENSYNVESVASSSQPGGSTLKQGTSEEKSLSLKQKSKYDQATTNVTVDQQQEEEMNSAKTGGGITNQASEQELLKDRHTPIAANANNGVAVGNEDAQQQSGSKRSSSSRPTIMIDVVVRSRTNSVALAESSVGLPTSNKDHCEAGEEESLRSNKSDDESVQIAIAQLDTNQSDILLSVQKIS